MANVPELPVEWYHARFQAVGRAQSRYLLTLLVVAAYTFGLDYTAEDTVGVTFLGLSNIPKRIVNAAATIVLSVLVLALYGSFRAARIAFADRSKGVVFVAQEKHLSEILVGVLLHFLHPAEDRALEIHRRFSETAAARGGRP